jgi:hypothetical protein
MVKYMKNVRNVLEPGANPTTFSYNASVVNIYNAASSLVRLKKFFYFEKRSSLLQRWRYVL